MSHCPRFNRQRVKTCLSPGLSLGLVRTGSSTAQRQPQRDRPSLRSRASREQIAAIAFGDFVDAVAEDDKVGAASSPGDVAQLIRRPLGAGADWIRSRARTSVQLAGGDPPRPGFAQLERDLGYGRCPCQSCPTPSAPARPSIARGLLERGLDPVEQRRGIFRASHLLSAITSARPSSTTRRRS